jgi:helicase MOV-10
LSYQERRVIIISTVRSNTNFVEFDINHTLGFVANPRRFNVAITRAQALLIIVGDPVVLSLDPMWREFLDYIHASGGWRGNAKDWESGDWAAKGPRNIVRERRNDARDAMDEFAQRIQDFVIDNLPGEDDASSDGEAAQDKPWREDE